MGPMDSAARRMSLELQIYQEQQSGGKCSVHSINAFAGGRVVDIGELFAVNTAVQQIALQGAGGQPATIQDLKNAGVYVSTLAELDAKGVSGNVIKSYIEKNKNNFYLSNDSSIKICEGRYASQEVQAELAKIQQSVNLHRVILGIGAKHYLAIRKDESGQWRVIDSQQVAHIASTDNTKSVQPGFATLNEAVKHVTTKYNNDGKTDACILIAPTKEKQDSRRCCS
jgi:hypothetical protein